MKRFDPQPATRTTLVIEPDDAAQRRLVRDLSARGHRVVPVKTAEEGLDLAKRFPFDIVMCSTRLAGLNWVEFFERVRDMAGAFVLMAQDSRAEHGTLLRSGQGFVLNLAEYDVELDRVLQSIEASLTRENALPARC